MNIEDLIRKYEDEKENASHQILLAKAEFHKYEDKPEYREAWIVSFNDLNKWIKAESIYARVLYDLRNLQEVNNLNYSEKPKSYTIDDFDKIRNEFKSDYCYSCRHKFKCIESKDSRFCPLDCFFEYLRDVPGHIADASKKVCKQYTIDELYDLHDKYEKKGDCWGYCGECGINMFFKWVRGLEEKE